MKKTTLFTLIIISIILFGCTSNNNVDQAQKDQNINQPITNIDKDININLSANPNYCQTNADCIAIPNPSNHCYSGYFNKNASEAIEEFKNNPKIMKQDCPKFSEVYCDNNKCTADRK